jgi:hypothetical protein
VILILYAVFPSNAKSKPFNSDIFYDLGKEDEEASRLANLTQLLQLNPNGSPSFRSRVPKPPGFHFVFHVDCQSGQHRTMAFTLIYSFLTMYTEDSGATLTELITYAQGPASL